MDNVELIMELEHEFDISISDDEVEQVRTVKHIIDGLEGRI